MCLEASENLFRVIFASKLPDAGALLFILAKLLDGCQNVKASGMHANQRDMRIYIEKSVGLLPRAT